MRKVTRGALPGTKVDVITADHPPHGWITPHPTPKPEHTTRSSLPDGDHAQESPRACSSKHTHAPHRHLSSILRHHRSTPLTDTAKARAIRAFSSREAEAAIHPSPSRGGFPRSRRGGHDRRRRLLRVGCGSARRRSLALDRLLKRWQRHGRLPSTEHCFSRRRQRWARSAMRPVYAAGPPMERVTPTGAAVLRMLKCARTAARHAHRESGYGAGGRDTPGEPNLLRLLVGETEEAPVEQSESIAIIETVIDDSSRSCSAMSASCSSPPAHGMSIVSPCK